MCDIILVLTATSSQDEAQDIADACVDKQLAAAVQVIGPVTSTYRWNNEKRKTPEWLCMIKTRQSLYLEIEHLIQASHSYELPGILAIPMISGSEKYFAWLMSETKEKTKVQIVQSFNEAHERLIAVSTAASKRVVDREGEWGPREVLAHIVGWEAEATSRIPLLAVGEAPLTYDDDAFNAAVVAVLGAQSFEAIHDMVRQTHQRLVQMLLIQDDSVFVPGHSVTSGSRL